MTLEFLVFLHWFNRVINNTETSNIFYVDIYIRLRITHLLVGVFIHIPDMYIGSIILNHIIGVFLSYPL